MSDFPNGYSRFVYSRWWLLRIIQWRTHSKWGHVEHVLRDGSVVCAWFPGGVQHWPVGERTDAAAELRCTVALTDAQVAAGEAFLLAQVGKKYDWFALLGLFFGANWSSKSQWFCSKLEDGYYKAMGVELVGTLPEPYATPARLAASSTWTAKVELP